jgi:hypothetical protein
LPHTFIARIAATAINRTRPQAAAAAASFVRSTYVQHVTSSQAKRAAGYVVCHQGWTVLTYFLSAIFSIVFADFAKVLVSSVSFGFFQIP